MKDATVNFLDTYLARIRDRIPQINNGGCGLFALHLYRALRDVGISSIIKLASHDEYKDSSCLIHHVFIHVDGLSLDATGVRERPMSSSYLTEITEKQLLDLILNGYWNMDFDRAANIGILKQHFSAKLKKAIKKYESSSDTSS